MNSAADSTLTNAPLPFTGAVTADASESVQTRTKLSDMPDDMQTYALTVAKDAKQKGVGGREIAKRLKCEFDEKYGRTWHCIVGSDFTSYVTHETSTSIFFYIGREAVLLWRTL